MWNRLQTWWHNYRNPIVSRCPICGEGFRKDAMILVGESPGHHQKCPGCGAWLERVVKMPSKEMGWFLIGFGDKPIPIEGKGPRK